MVFLIFLKLKVWGGGGVKIKTKDSGEMSLYGAMKSVNIVKNKK